MNIIPNFKKFSEEICLLSPLEVEDIQLYILDESSQMYTCSFKALDAAICISDCLNNGINEICFSSGVNTGTALTAYANDVGISTHFFIPAQNIWKLDRRYVCSQLNNIYSVKDSQMTKILCERFSRETGIPVMPHIKHRKKAGYKRGAFIESLINKGYQFDWFVQTVCAGFGPIGIYEYLLDKYKVNPFSYIPRFIGIQQAGNDVLARYLSNKIDHGRIKIENSEDILIESTMYDQYPETYRTFPEMEKVIISTDGSIITITKSEFDIYLSENQIFNYIINHLEQNGIRLARIAKNECSDEFVQKSGLIAIAGVLKAIKKGIIRKGQKILCSFSGGATTDAFDPISNDFCINICEPYDKILNSLTSNLK